MRGIPKQVGSSRWQFVALAMFCCGWGGNQFSPLLAMYRELGYPSATVDAFLGAYVIGVVPGLLIAGPLSDRHGRKPLMIVATAVSGLASAVMAAAPPGELSVYSGRFLAGIAVGIAMTVGSSWIKELSGPPYEQSADAGSGARRASVAATAGFGSGAAVAGVLAQWAPWPMVLPYLVQVVVAVPCLVAVSRAPQPPPAGFRRPLWSDVKVRAAGNRRFLGVALPLAPWIFGAVGIAYAVAPQLETSRTGHWQLAYATLLTVVTLGTGVAVQPLAKRLDSVASARASLVALGLVLVGVLASAVNADARSPWAAVAVAAVLGAGYSIALVAGLREVQRIAGARDLAGLTGLYYALSYAGFLLPTALALASAVASYTELLLAVAGMVGCSLLVVLFNSTRNVPCRSEIQEVS
ncbi:MFS transporter [Pseudonocardia aurantiaca]